MIYLEIVLNIALKGIYQSIINTNRSSAFIFMWACVCEFVGITTFLYNVNNNLYENPGLWVLMALYLNKLK
jgi:hypothetical protein